MTTITQPIGEACQDANSVSLHVVLLGAGMDGALPRHNALHALQLTGGKPSTPPTHTLTPTPPPTHTPTHTHTHTLVELVQ